MDREQYISCRNSNQIPINLAYEFYVSKNPNPCIPFDMFIETFQSYLQMFQPNMEEFFKFYDLKFEVHTMTFLKDKTVKFY